MSNIDRRGNNDIRPRLIKDADKSAFDNPTTSSKVRRSYITAMFYFIIISYGNHMEFISNFSRYIRKHR